jgi:hypothetical protein
MASFTLSLSASASDTVTVGWATADGTATVANGDYVAASGTATFEPGVTTQSVTVQVNGDTVEEANENFYVNLSGASGATIADGQGAGTILNDDLQPPVAPSTLTAAAVSSSQINLTWKDNAGNESSYYVERSVSGGAWGRLVTLAANATSYSDTGLQPQTSYSYRVQAYNAAGVSAYSNEATATTQERPTIHVGDLDGSRSVGKKNWSATVTVTVHDAGEKLVTGAVVGGGWSAGTPVSGSCTTSRRGTCTITASGIPLGTTSVSFKVSGVTLTGYTYLASANHDVDRGTDGTTITITR